MSTRLNFNNGDVTLTHSACTLTVAGGTLAAAAITGSGLITGGTFSTGNSGTAKFLDGDGSHFFTLAAHATTTASVGYTWPAADGSCGQVLSTNSSGVLSWATAGGGPSQANQTAIECETNQDTYIPPDLLKYHPGIAKTWVDLYQPGTPSVNGCGSYNVASVCDVSVGQTNILHATDMSTVDYARTANTGSLHAYINGCTTTAALMRVVTKNACHNAEDSGDVQVMAFGDFA